MTTGTNKRDGIVLCVFCLLILVCYSVQLPSLPFRDTLPLGLLAGLLVALPLLFKIEWVSSWVKKMPPSLPVILPAALLLGVIVYYLWNYCGQILLHDDHSSFLQREWVLLSNIPRVFIYDPYFNAGEASEGVLLSGAVNLLLVTAPLRAFFSFECSYGLQPLLIILLVPASLYGAARLLGLSRGEGFLAAFLSLVATLPGGYLSLPSFIRFGMLPYVFSTLLSLLVFGLFWRFFLIRRGGLPSFLALVLLSFLAVLHLSFAVILAPLVLSVPWLLRGKGALGRLPWLLAFVATLLLHLVWFVPFWTLYHENPKTKVVASSPFQTAPATEGVERDEGSASLLERIPWGLRSRLCLNPLLYSGVIVALSWLVRGRGRVRGRGGLLLCMILYLSVLVWVGNFFAGFLQPGRYLLPLSLYLILPSSSFLAPFLGRVLRDGSYVGRAAVVSLFAAGMVFIGNYALPVPETPRKIPALTSWLRENTDPLGRIYFEDFPDALGGHLAYLQVMADRAFVGEQYEAHGLRVHNRSRLTDFEPGELARYFDLYNILYVVVRSPRVVGLLSEAPCARLVKSFEDISVFKTNAVPGYFLRGKGSAKASYNRIDVRMDEKGDGILKFRWVPGLKGSPGLAIEPHRTFTDEEFIHVHAEKAGSYVISYQRWRLL